MLFSGLLLRLVVGCYVWCDFSCGLIVLVLLFFCSGRWLVRRLCCFRFRSVLWLLYILMVAVSCCVGWCYCLCCSDLRLGCWWYCLLVGDCLWVLVVFVVCGCGLVF